MQQGRVKHPENIRLAVSYGKIAMARKSWPEAVTRWLAILDEFAGNAPAEVYLKLSHAFLRQGNIQKAEESLRQGLAKHSANVRLATSYAAMGRSIGRGGIARGRYRISWMATHRPQCIYSLVVFIAVRAILRAPKNSFARAWPGIPAMYASSPSASRLHWLARIGAKSLKFVMRQWMSSKPNQTAVIDDRQLATVCNVLMINQDYDRVIAVVQDLKRREGESKLLLEIEGMAYLRSSRTEAAHLHWTRSWQKARHDQVFARQRAPALASYDALSKNFFTTLSRSDEFIPHRADGRFCVYTALFGEYDDLRSPAYVPPGLKFICFSDRARDVPGWEVRIVDPELDSPAMNSRKPKILPYDYLEGYDCSLYIDANIVFLADPLVAYHRWLKDKSFVAWRHPDRSGVYEEIEAILTSLRHAPSALIDQHKFFGDHAVPEHTGLIEACFLWRDHRDGAVRELMEQWWELLARFGSHRDQPALGYLMWKTGIRPALLPDYLGTSRDNEFVRKLPHKQTVLKLERAKVVRRGTENGAWTSPTDRRCAGAGNPRWQRARGV